MSEYDTRLSTHDEESISLREKDLATEVMDQESVPATAYYLWTGEEPTPGQERLLGAMFTSLVVHGVTPSSLVSRLTLLSEPDAVQTAVGNAINGVGSRYIGTMKECSELLERIVAADDRDAAVADVVAEHRERGASVPGVGHPHLDPVDPRAERLFAIAEDEGISGSHTAALRALQDALGAETGAELPINVTGAIAALSSDMGLSPSAARGVAVVSRATGVVGEVLEEQKRPIAGEVWQHVDDNATGPEG